MLSILHIIALLLGMSLLILNTKRFIFEKNEEVFTIFKCVFYCYFTAILIAIVKVLTGDILDIVLVAIDGVALYYLIGISTNINDKCKELIEKREYIEYFKYLFN